jgi:hypothetical protein
LRLARRFERSLRLPGGSFRSVFKELRQRLEMPRLWRRVQFFMILHLAITLWRSCIMVQCRLIIALILVRVCDGGYGKNVMKKR